MTIGDPVNRFNPNAGNVNYLDLSNLPVIPFAPTGKYSPLKMMPRDGWANGNAFADSPALHDASAGAIPSFTTAKRRSIAVVSVAGTLNGVSCAKGDYLMALKKNPTLASDWAIIADSTSEFETIVEAFPGSPIDLNGGTIYLNAADPDAQIGGLTNGTILYRCNSPAIYQASNDTYATTNTVQSKIASVTTSTYTETNTGTSLDKCTRLTLNTKSDISNYVNGMMMTVFTDATTPDAASGSKQYIKESFYIRALGDSSNGYIYADRVLRWQTEIAAATNIYVNNINADRAMEIDDSVTFMGAPTYIGESVAWWMNQWGSEVTATLSSSTHIARTAHGLNTGDYVQVTLSTGDYTHGTTVPVTKVDADNFTVVVPSTDDYSATAPGWGASGTIYYRPSFIISNATHHGAAVTLDHANLSFIRMKHAKPWSMGVNARFTAFCDIEVYAYDGNDPYTNNNNVTGRLIYQCNDYSSSNNIYRIKGKAGRHAYTSNGPSTSSSWAASMWSSQGMSVNSRVFVEESNADGGGADTHAGSNGVDITSFAYFPAELALEGSYHGFGGNIRGSNETRNHKQIGGYEGIVARATENQAGSIHVVDLDVRHLPYNTTSQMAFRTEALTAITNKYKVKGKWRIEDAGVGFKLLDGQYVHLSQFEHTNVAKYAGWLQGSSTFKADVATVSYVNNTSGQTTRNPFMMENASTIEIGTLYWDMGAANNPTEIFTDNDNASGKIVTVGMIVIDDPSAVGIPLFITSGRAANFTLKIGMVLYNGKVIYMNGGGINFAPGYVSGRYYGPPTASTMSTAAVSANLMQFCATYVSTRATFTAIGYNCTANTNSANAHFGVYNADGAGGIPGTLVSGTEVTVATVGVAVADATFNSAVTLDPGWYWIAVLSSANSLTFTGHSTSGPNSHICGVGTLQASATGQGVRVGASQAYGALPSTAPALSYTEATSNVWFGLKAQ